MRIIDKRHDFYDYLQDSTDNLVFDRRDSFLLTKEMVCYYLNNNVGYYKNSRDNIVLLQCGATFWLFLLTVTKYGSIYAEDYEIKLITRWKNYEAPNRLLKLSIVWLSGLWRFNYKTKESFIKTLNNNLINYMKESVDRNDYREEYIICENKYPLLKACGIGNVVNPDDMFYAIEEYFSIEKSKLEKTEAEGTTDKSKIVNHGFDLKTSFRGK